MTGQPGDHLIRAVALDGRARVVAALTTDIAEELRRVHDPSPQVAAALARISTGALLLAATLEKVTSREPVLTLEADGGGPAGRIVATASPAGWVRAMATNPLAATPRKVDGDLDVAGVVGRGGQLAVTRDSGHGDPYRGVVDLVSGDLAKDLAVYLSESEQSPAAVVFGVLVIPEGRVAVAGGMLIQLLPGVSNEEAENLVDHISELGALSSRIADGDGPREWLATVFPDGCTILDEIPVRFLCGCSTERVEAALKLLGVGEIRAAMDEDNDRRAELTCGFCHEKYTLPHKRLRELLAELEAERKSLRSDLPND
jgi:molecular chaperone Hsp33